MKNTGKLIGILALVAIIGLFASCGEVGDSGVPLAAAPSGSLPAGTSFSVSGTFAGKKFSLANVGEYIASRAAVSPESYAIEGELEDGDIIFRLKGTYDPVARNYTASAASSIIRYSIGGSFDETGASLGSTATVSAKVGDNWTMVTHVVEEAEVTISDTKPILGEDPEAEMGAHQVVTSGGIPSWAQGWWSYTESWGEWSISVKALLTEWTIMQEVVMTDQQKPNSQTSTVIKAEEKVNNSWDVILSYPVYKGNKNQVFAAVQAFIAAKKNSVTNPHLKTMMNNAQGLDRNPNLSENQWTVRESTWYNEHGQIGGTFFSLMFFDFDVSSAINNEMYEKNTNQTHLINAFLTFIQSQEKTAVELSGDNLAIWNTMHNQDASDWYIDQQLTFPVPGTIWYHLYYTSGYGYRLATNYADFFTSQQYNDLMPPSFNSKDEAKTYAQTFLTANGYTGQTYVDLLELPENGLYYWYEDGDVNVGFETNLWQEIMMEGGDPQPVMDALVAAFDKLVTEFYMTNYLERYLLEHYTITPEIRYSKINVEFSNNRNEMTAMNYVGGNVEGNEYEWTTLTGATNATTLQDPYNEWGYPTTTTLSRTR